MWESAFGEDDAEVGSETSSGADVEYNFEGFNIEFSEKIALMPAGASGKTPGDGVRDG